MLRLGFGPSRGFAAAFTFFTAATGASALEAGAQDPLTHLKALEQVAAANGGNRAAGTPGYDRSADYVADQLRQAGYEVRFEEFTFQISRERTPPVLLTGAARTPAPQGAVRSFTFAGTGDVTAPLRAVNLGLTADGSIQTTTSGCSAEEFTGFEKGAIALMRRGTCPFAVKVQNAIAAGAAGIVFMNDGSPGQRDSFVASLGRPAALPVVGVSYDFGVELAKAAASKEDATIRLALDIETVTRRSHNVIAEMAGADRGTLPVVVVGAHLDSVLDGPGLNDNGSGVAAVLAGALRVADQARTGRMHLRFGFWSAEEVALTGSRHYVGQLSDEERKRIAVYVNLDMVGSPNFARLVLVEPDAQGPALTTAKAMADHFAARPLPAERRAPGPLGTFSTDMASFKARGIPIVGLYTGSAEIKSADQVTAFGGQAGQPHDTCYHRSCDTMQNVNGAVVREMADSLTEALRALASAP